MVTDSGGEQASLLGPLEAMIRRVRLRHPVSMTRLSDCFSHVQSRLGTVGANSLGFLEDTSQQTDSR